MTQAKEIIAALETIAPTAYQESYDNSGLQVGNPDAVVTGILLTLDVTEAVLDEAVARSCNMIVAHHPVIFSGLKKLAGRTYVERIVQRAVKQDILLYAIHTNLDNARAGVNARIADKLGLQQTSILDMKTDTLRKLCTYVPQEAADAVRDALFAAGAGALGQYRECSFNVPGTGTFKPGKNTNPAIGTAGGQREWVSETKIEVLVLQHLEARILNALFSAHPYEEVAYEMIHLQNANQEIGAGMIGILQQPLPGIEFLKMLRQNMNAACIRHTALLSKPVSKVAVCGGSGQFLLKHAMAQGADVFITADFKYHQFFDAEGRIVIADIGHWESEQFTPELLRDILTEKFPNFALLLSAVNTNPVNYFC